MTDMSQTNPSAASLPPITALRGALDYGDAKSARCTFFYDDIRHFRRKFTTSTGILGVELYDWKDAAHQTGLTELTTSYLDQHGNGPLFWPDDKLSQNYNRLQYSTHRDSIHTWVKQLFFRLNLQQFRNRKYKNKDRAESGDETPQGSTANPIDVDSISTEPAEPRQYTGLPGDEQAAASIDPELDPTSDGAAKKGGTDLENIYRFPFPIDPELASPTPAENPPNLGASATRRGRGRRQPQQAAKTRQTKAKRRVSEEGPRRTSSRPQRKRQRDDYVYGNAVFQACATQSPTPVESTPGNPSANPSPIIRHSVEEPTVAGGDPPPIPVADMGIVDEGPRRETTDDNMSERARAAVDGLGSLHMPPTRSPTVESRLHEHPTWNIHHPGTGPHEVNPPGAGASSKIQIQFSYVVVISHRPVQSYKAYKLSRPLEQTSLREFLEELDLSGDVEKLVITTDGPGLQAEMQLCRDDELGFRIMKRMIRKAIAAELSMRQGTGQPLELGYAVQIEPVLAPGNRGVRQTDDLEFQF